MKIMKTKRRCSLIYHQLGTCNFRFFVYGYFLVLIFNVCISISVFLSIYCFFFCLCVSRSFSHTISIYLSLYHYHCFLLSFPTHHIYLSFCLSIYLSICSYPALFSVSLTLLFTQIYFYIHLFPFIFFALSFSLFQISSNPIMVIPTKYWC